MTTHAMITRAVLLLAVAASFTILTGCISGPHQTSTISKGAAPADGKDAKDMTPPHHNHPFPQVGTSGPHQDG